MDQSSSTEKSFQLTYLEELFKIEGDTIRTPVQQKTDSSFGISNEISLVWEKADDLFIRNMMLASETKDFAEKKKIIAQTVSFFDAITVAEFSGSGDDRLRIQKIRNVLEKISNDVSDSYKDCYDQEGNPKPNTAELQAIARDNATKFAVTNAVDLIRSVEPENNQSEAELKSQIFQILDTVTFEDIMEMTRLLLSVEDQAVHFKDAPLDLLIPILEKKQDYFTDKFKAMDHTKESVKTFVSSNTNTMKRLYSLLMSANVAWASSQPHRAALEKKPSRVTSSKDNPFQNYATLPLEGFYAILDARGKPEEAIVYSAAIIYKDIFELKKHLYLLEPAIPVLEIERA